MARGSLGSDPVCAPTQGRLEQVLGASECQLLGCEMSSLFCTPPAQEAPLPPCTQLTSNRMLPRVLLHPKAASRSVFVACHPESNPGAFWNLIVRSTGGGESQLLFLQLMEPSLVSGFLGESWRWPCVGVAMSGLSASLVWTGENSPGSEPAVRRPCPSRLTSGF